MIILAFINFAVLFLLSALHFYWGLGGTWAFDSSLPTNDEGKQVLNPKPLDSLVLGIGLLFFASFHLIRMAVITLPLPAWLMNSGLWIIGGIFLFRAIGDFKYIGFFKRIKSTIFAEKDTKYYSPLCLGIGLIAILLEIA